MLGVGFVPLRKSGKLPRKAHRASYELEYGKAELEMHIDALDESDSVLLIDDVLATGGTAAAAIQLVEKTGAIVNALGFVIEIKSLGGEKKLRDYNVKSLLTY